MTEGQAMSEKKPLLDCGEPVKPGCYLAVEQENHFLETLDGRSICCRCSYWDQFDDPGWNSVAVKSHDMAIVDWDGYCRRNAPALPTAAIIEEGEDCNQGAWPWTRYADWCGEYQEGKAC